MGKMKNKIFRVENVVTTAKALVLSLIFWLVWAFWNFVGLAIGNLGRFFEVVSYIIIASFLIVGLFVYGYLAKTLWGWK